MTRRFVELLVLCSWFYIIGAQNPDAMEKECSQVLKNLVAENYVKISMLLHELSEHFNLVSNDVYISGIPEIKNWKYEETGNLVRCKGTLTYSSPMLFKLGCHRRTQNFLYNELIIYKSNDDDDFASDGDNDMLDLIINSKYNNSTIECNTIFPNSASTSIIVQLLYEPNNTLPEHNRLNLANAITYEIRTYDIGDVCDTNTNITVKAGPLMVKIFGKYDKVDHFWCQNLYENLKVFLTKDDFTEYENPKEAIAIIDTRYIGENHTQWNCTLLTRKGAPINRNNLYYYGNDFYSKISCKGSVHIVEAEIEENKLTFKLKSNDSGCRSVEPTRNFTIKDGSTLTVKVSNISPYLYKFWCGKVGKDTQSNSKVLEAQLTYYKYFRKRPYYAVASVPIPSLHGEFDCFLGKGPYSYDIQRNNSIYYEKCCQVRLNIIGSTSNLSDSRFGATPQTAVLGVAFVTLGLAGLIFLYWRQWKLNKAALKAQDHQERAKMLKAGATGCADTNATRGRGRAARRGSGIQPPYQLTVIHESPASRGTMNIS